MSVKKRDIVLISKNTEGENTIDMPVTRLGNIEDDAEIKETPASGDYIPIMDSMDGGQMKKTPYLPINEKAVAYTTAETLAKMVTGEKLGAAFGKIAKAVDELITHLSDSVRHITAAERTAWNGKAAGSHAHSAASQSAAGFMSAADKTKLDGITAGANKYTHPTTSGNKHIPSGGSSGQILRWSADGTAAWGADNNTTYANMTAASASAAGKAGLVPAPAAGAQAKYLRGDGTWQTPPDTNTTYSAATQSANGLMSAADKKKLDGIGAGANKYTHPTTAGNKHIPAGGSSGQILRWSADGTAAWGAENNTTYGVATQSANGLMSAADKKKLDGLKNGGDSYFLVISDKSSGTGNVASLGASTFSDDPNAASDTVSPNAAIGGGVEISKTMYLNLVKNGTTVVSSIPLNVSGIYGQIVTI